MRWLLALSGCALFACGPSKTVGGRGGAGGDLGSGGDDGSVGDGGDDAQAGGVDLLQLDGPPGTAYSDLGKSDSGLCTPPMVGASCAMPIAGGAGCGAVELCGSDGTGDGLDNNCDGQVDEGCACTPGAVHACFLGPPGKRNIGACTDGTQTCFGQEFGAWGACSGGIGPSAEICDALDNDCNGCADDGLCCGTVLACPAPGDPRIAPAPPYTDVALKGELFFTGSAASWKWTITGGPCDQLFATTTGSPPVQSFTLTGANLQDATAHFTLSGDYTITMTVIGTDGATYTCTWVQHIIGPGVRFELCWDHTGPGASGGADLDLHVHRSGTTNKWFQLNNGKANLDDCNYSDCNPDAYSICSLISCAGLVSNWGYGAGAIAQCAGAPATEQGDTWTGDAVGCPNPRLDLDNIDIVGRPENANIDTPKNGDSFRAMVHYYGQDSSVSSSTVEEHPIVNIYCGGVLKATYGAAPNTLGPCPGATCFNNGLGWNAGQMWRVADVAAQVDALGNTTGCTVTPIHPAGTLSGYSVTNNVTTY